MEKQNNHSNNTCPIGMDSIKKIALTKKEKRAIFLNLINEIHKPKFRVDLSKVELIEEEEIGA
jgi:hypothetical protein